MNLYIPQSVSNIPKPAFGWGKSSGLLECDVKVADAENVPEKGVSDFYSYWNIFFSAMSAFCVSGCARSQHVCSLGKWENYCWRRSFLMDYCSQHQTASAVSVGSVHHDSDLFWTSITASVTNPAETRLAKSVPVKFEWTSSSPPLSQWAWCDHTLTAEVRRKQGSFQQQRRTTAAENMGIVPSRVSRC